MDKTLNTQISQGIGYEGKVTLNLFKNNKLINKYPIHNTGRITLFEFFISCLAAQWDAAYDKYPNKIVLFRRGADDETDFDATYWTEDYIVTPAQGIIQASVPEKTSNENGSCSVKYHFRIPTALIAGGDAGQITKVGLYNNLVQLENPLAYIFVPTAIQEELAAANNNPNLVIILDWELIISNKVSLTVSTTESETTESETTESETTTE